MKIFIIILVFINLYADSKEKVFNLYQKEEYKKACDLGYKKIKLYKNDESFLSLYGFSCLNAGYIDRLTVPISVLKSNKEYRQNSVYFSMIVMQKNMLYHSMIDGYKLQAFNLPTTEHIISRVFDLYAKMTNKMKKTIYKMKDPKNKQIFYKMYLQKDNKKTKIIIEELYNDKIIKTHTYW